MVQISPGPERWEQQNLFLLLLMSLETLRPINSKLFRNAPFFIYTQNCNSVVFHYYFGICPWAVLDRGQQGPGPL